MAFSWHRMISFTARSSSPLIFSIRVSSATWATSTNCQARSGRSLRICRISGTASLSPFSALPRRPRSSSTVLPDSSIAAWLIADISGAGESPAGRRLSRLFFGLTFSPPFSSLVSSESGAQKCCSIQDLRGFAQLLYRGHERFEPLALFLPQGSLFFPPPTLLGIVQGCEVPDDAAAYVLPHHSAADLLATRVVEAASFSLFPSHIDRWVTKAVQPAGGNTTVDEPPEHPPFLAVARSCHSSGSRLLEIWATTGAPAS